MFIPMRDIACLLYTSKTFRIAFDVVKSKKSNPKVGVEKYEIPCTIYPFFVENFGEGNLVNLAEFISDIRKIKLPWEVDVLRYSAQVAEKMMNITCLLYTSRRLHLPEVKRCILC